MQQDAMKISNIFHDLALKFLALIKILIILVSKQKGNYLDTTCLDTKNAQVTVKFLFQVRTASRMKKKKTMYYQWLFWICPSKLRYVDFLSMNVLVDSANPTSPKEFLCHPLTDELFSSLTTWSPRAFLFSICCYLISFSLSPSFSLSLSLSFPASQSILYRSQ